MKDPADQRQKAPQLLEASAPSRTNASSITHGILLSSRGKQSLTPLPGKCRWNIGLSHRRHLPRLMHHVGQYQLASFDGLGAAL